MGWEAALAADVEHMPLMIHTVCGRSAAAAELGAFTSDLNRTPPPFLVCVMLCFVWFVFFFSPLRENSRGTLFTRYSPCLMAPLKNKAEKSAPAIFVLPLSSVLSSFSNAATLQSDSLFLSSSFCSSARLTDIMLGFYFVAALLH